MNIYTAHIIANGLTALFVGGYYLAEKYRDVRGVGGALAVLFVVLCSARDMPYFGGATSWFLPMDVSALLNVNLVTLLFIASAYFAFWPGQANRKVGLVGMVGACVCLYGLVYASEHWNH